MKNGDQILILRKDVVKNGRCPKFLERGAGNGDKLGNEREREIQSEFSGGSGAAKPATLVDFGQRIFGRRCERVRRFFHDFLEGKSGNTTSGK